MSEDSVVVIREQDTVLVVRSPAQGPPGISAQGPSGQPRFTGHGAPGVIIGAHPQDVYLDLDTCDLYELN